MSHGSPRRGSSGRSRNRSTRSRLQGQREDRDTAAHAWPGTEREARIDESPSTSFAGTNRIRFKGLRLSALSAPLRRSPVGRPQANRRVSTTRTDRVRYRLLAARREAPHLEEQQMSGTQPPGGTPGQPGQQPGQYPPPPAGGAPYPPQGNPPGTPPGPWNYGQPPAGGPPGGSGNNNKVLWIILGGIAAFLVLLGDLRGRARGGRAVTTRPEGCQRHGEEPARRREGLPVGGRRRRREEGAVAGSGAAPGQGVPDRRGAR